MLSSGLRVVDLGMHRIQRKLCTGSRAWRSGLQDLEQTSARVLRPWDANPNGQTSAGLVWVCPSFRHSRPGPAQSPAWRGHRF